MKLMVLVTITAFMAIPAFACKRTPEAFEQAVKLKLTAEWRTLPRYNLPIFDTLPYTLNVITKDTTTGNYKAEIKRGQTICKQLIYQVSGNADCSIEASLISIQGCSG